ncbi:MAG: G5 domain-containing protein [Oscillospiraceae bacterium]|nr:G5 domain-containing protein [Oscillospiraceae bacterium]
MKSDEKASLSIRKMLIITLVFVFVLGVVAVAGDAELNSVTIQFSNNHEITILTSRTKVSEILADNNIILASNEVVMPALDEEITDSRTIEIFIEGTREIEEIEVAEESDENDIQEIIQRYENITHKILVETEEIPYETITRDTSRATGNTTNRVVQVGVNGLRETRYKVTYQNDVEIARVELDSIVVTEPVNRIVEIQTRSTTRAGARTAAPTTSTNREVAQSGWFQITAYCSCLRCTGSGRGITASGTRATANRTIAADPRFPFGTQMRINGVIYTVEDRGGAVRGNVLDIYKGCHQTALRWGRRTVYVEILN